MPCALNDGFSSPYNAYGQPIDTSSDTSSGTADLHVTKQAATPTPLQTNGYGESWQSQWSGQLNPLPKQQHSLQATTPQPPPQPTAQSQYESLFTLQPKQQPQLGGATQCSTSVFHVLSCPTCKAALATVLHPQMHQQQFSLSAWAQQNQVLFIGIVALLLFLLDKFIMLRYRR